MQLLCKDEKNMKHTGYNYEDLSLFIVISISKIMSLYVQNSILSLLRILI